MDIRGDSMFKLKYYTLHMVKNETGNGVQFDTFTLSQNFLTNFNEDQNVVTLLSFSVCWRYVILSILTYTPFFLINTRLFSSLHFQRTLSESSQSYSTCILVMHPAWDAGLGLVITIMEVGSRDIWPADHYLKPLGVNQSGNFAE